MINESQRYNLYHYLNTQIHNWINIGSLETSNLLTMKIWGRLWVLLHNYLAGHEPC